MVSFWVRDFRGVVEKVSFGCGVFVGTFEEVSLERGFFCGDFCGSRRFHSSMFVPRRFGALYHDGTIYIVDHFGWWYQNGSGSN